MDLVRQIENQWKTNQLVTKGDHIIAGVSGGADSVCLLAVLCQLSEKWHLTVTAVHVNHCIRQETALRDAAFVEEFCRRCKVECHVIKTDVPRIARENGLSLEAAGRMERYRIFEEIRVQYGAQSIAVAHHMDDNAETILFQLLRGSGLKGLGGMGIRRGAVIRPLLFLTRNQIEEWVEQQGLPFVTDETNFSREYTRNRIRLEVLPYLEKYISPNARQHIAECGAICREADDYLRQEAEQWMKRYADWKEKGGFLPAEEFSRQHPAPQKYVIRLALERLGSGLKDIGHIHVEEIRGLFLRPVGKECRLPGSIGARRTYRGVLLEKYGPGESSSVQDHGPGEIGQLEMKIGNCSMEMRVFLRKKNEKIPENTYTKWFDYDTIKHTVSMRTRMAGDRISVLAGGSKKLKDYMIDAKIPREWRDQIPLIVDGSHVMWVVGYRISEAYKVTQKTERILQIQVRKTYKRKTCEEGAAKNGGKNS